MPYYSQRMISTGNVGSLQSAFSSGLSTIAAGSRRLSQDAQQIADPNSSATAPLVDTKQASLQAQAGAAVVRTANEMLGSLIDAFA